MDNFYNPAPIDREIKVNSSAVLMCKINKDNVIEYINHSFSEVSGYEEFEIIGESMDKLRHPDMPKVIYELLKERFENLEPIRLINKVLAKDGRFFWLISDYESKVSETTSVVAHYGHCFAAPSFAIHKVEALYKILYNIEQKSHSTETSKRYLIGFLEERNMTYNQFIEDLSLSRPEFEETFPVNDYTPGRPQPIAKSAPEMQIPSRTNAPAFNNPIPQQQVEKVKKKKSLLKKVFGK
jgi:PAS domain S-box-containing protein